MRNIEAGFYGIPTEMNVIILVLVKLYSAVLLQHQPRYHGPNLSSTKVAMQQTDTLVLKPILPNAIPVRIHRQKQTETCILMLRLEQSGLNREIVDLHMLQNNFTASPAQHANTVNRERECQ